MKLSKGTWRRIGILSVAVFCLVLVINFAVLFKIYGCVGASFNAQPAQHGICSDQGLRMVQTITRVFQIIIGISLVGTVVGFIKSSTKND